MRLSTQLLGAITGITLLALLVFGAVAYWIMTEAGEKRRAELLAHLAGDILAEFLARDAAAPDSSRVAALHRKHGPPGSLLAVWRGEAVAVVADGPVPPGLSRRLRVLAGEGRRRGRLRLRGADHRWAMAATPSGEAGVFLAEPRRGTDPDAATLRTRLLVTGVVILWLAVWVALILAALISRRLEEKNEALRHQALHDGLTGLPNRTLLLDRLAQVLLAARRRPVSFALLLMDLDRFKEINDTLGHHFGDLLLREVGRRIQASIRENDSLARLGGDEFAVLLPDTGREGALLCATRITRHLQRRFSVEGLHIETRASIGIALYPEHGDDGVTLLQRADVAMYQAKRSGNDFALYDPGRDSHSVRRLRLMGELREAVSAGQMLLHYQPMLDLRSGAVSGAEVLVRWRHPELGLVAPGEFIPLAEQMGAIHPLTLWVLETALARLRAWRREGIEMVLSVNLSAHCLQDASLPATVESLLHRHEIPPGALQLEITESALMHDLDRARDMLGRFHTLGVHLAIDDFGTGFSSLAYLRRLSFDELKIDKSFVRDMCSDPNDASIVRAVIDLAHNLGCRVVAEGVEDDRTLARLRELDCDRVQGFYLSPPLAADDAGRWFRDHGHRAADPPDDDGGARRDRGTDRDQPRRS